MLTQNSATNSSKDLRISATASITSFAASFIAGHFELNEGHFQYSVGPCAAVQLLAFYFDRGRVNTIFALLVWKWREDGTKLKESC